MTELIMHEILVQLDSIYKKVEDESLEQKDLKNLAQLRKAILRDKTIKILQESTKFDQIRIENKQTDRNKADKTLVIDPNAEQQQENLVDGWHCL